MTPARARYLASCRHASASTEMLAATAVVAAAARIARKPAPAPIAPHNLAAYLAATGLGIGIKRMARVTGRQPVSVRRAFARIEDRRDDPVFDGYLEACA